MLSGKLVRFVETHGDQIIARVLEEIRRNPALSHVKAMVQSDVRHWGGDLMQHLDLWLSKDAEAGLKHRYQQNGKLLFERQVPLDEGLLCLFLIREEALDCLEDELMASTVVDLYSEQELVRRMSRFFDALAVNVAKGYEAALRDAGAATHRAPAY